MKKLLLFAIIIMLSLVFSKQTNAQDLVFEKNLKNAYNHTIEGVHKTPAGNFLVSTRSRPSLYLIELSYTFLFDSLGNQLWMKETMNPNFSIVWNYTENREEYIFHGSPIFCDWCATGYYGQWNFFIIDENGNQLHNEYLNYYLTGQPQPQGLLQELNYFYPECVGSMLLENNAVVGIGKRFFQKLSANGTVIQFNSLPIDILGTQQFAIDKALAIGLDYVYILNGDGSLDSLNPLPFEVQKTSYIDHSHVLVQSTSNTYHVVDTIGTVLYNYDSQVDFSEVYHILFKDDYFWVLGKNANGVELRKYSETSGYDLIQMIDTTDFKPVSFELWDNHFILIGYETKLKNQHLVVKGIVYNETEAEINFPDVGIEELFTPVIYRYGQSFHYKVTLNVRVKNYGNQIVDSLWLNAALPSIPPFGFIGSQTCKANFYSAKFDNLNLQPNQDTILQTIQFLTMVHSDLLDGKSCIWTSLPNGKRDLISENDEACSFEYVLNVTNIDFSETIKIFPNPGKDVLQIQFTTEPKNQLQVQIYDLSGRLIQSETLQRGQLLYQITVGGLNEGAYLLQINDGEKQGRKVFVKANE
jgi:hypothetical protein